MATRIDVQTGAGRLDVVVDLRPATTTPDRLLSESEKVTPDQDYIYLADVGYRYPLQSTLTGDGRLWAYDGEPEFHAALGGLTYYKSRSRSSCAGWIPAQAGVARVGTYRVDTRRPELPRLEDVPTIYGRKLVVPVSYRDREVAWDWPVLDVTDLVQGLESRGLSPFWTALDPYWMPVLTLPEQARTPVKFLGVDDILPLLTGEDVGFKDVEVEFASTRPEQLKDGCVPVTRAITVTAQATSRVQHLRRVLGAILWPILRWRPCGRTSTVENVHFYETPAHWVGMRRCGDHAYVIRGGVGVRAVAAETLSSPEELNRHLPTGLVAVAPDLVVGRGQIWTPTTRQGIDPATELRLVRRDARAIKEFSSACTCLLCTFGDDLAKAEDCQSE